MYTVTITAKSGPGVQSTAIVLTNVSQILYNWTGLTVNIVSNNQTFTYSLSGVTTITTTPASKTITIS